MARVMDGAGLLRLTAFDYCVPNRLEHDVVRLSAFGNIVLVRVCGDARLIIASQLKWSEGMVEATQS